MHFSTVPTLSEAETSIGLTQKRGGTTAYQALLPVNKHK